MICEATLIAAKPEGGTRGHLSADEAVAAFRDSGAKRLLLTHRPDELPLDPGLERAYDGYELEL
jgi:ribonuclease BN (tRNA processing enzyme)